VGWTDDSALSASLMDRCSACFFRRPLDDDLGRIDGSNG
jgi:hypothetical protein